MVGWSVPPSKAKVTLPPAGLGWSHAVALHEPADPERAMLPKVASPSDSAWDRGNIPTGQGAI